MLTDNRSDTRWFHHAADHAKCFCLTRGRLKFLRPDGESGAPINGSCLFYFGKAPERFTSVFQHFGMIAGRSPARSVAVCRDCRCTYPPRTTKLMDAATAAEMSDPDRNKWFRRRWTEPPHLAECRRPRTPEPNQDVEPIGAALREQWRRGAGGEIRQVTPVTLAGLASLPRWVGWRSEPRNRKPTKVPFAADRPHGQGQRSGGWALRKDAEAWIRTYVNGSGGGVGLQLGPVQGQDYALGGIDLDSCRDPVSGAIEPWALEVITRVGSYAEVSPSATGVKVFLCYANTELPVLRAVMGAEGPGKQFKCGVGEHPPAIELYLGNRYFAVTDRHLEDTPLELRLVDLQTLLWLLTEAGPALKRGGTYQSTFDHRVSAAASATAELDTAESDEESERLAPREEALLARRQVAMRWMPKLAARWHGSTDGLQDTSRSGMDMSMTALLKRAQFSFEDARALLLRWPHGAGTEHAGDDRYFRRMWERGGPHPDTDEDGVASHNGGPASTELHGGSRSAKASPAANRFRCRDRRQGR